MGDIKRMFVLRLRGNSLGRNFTLISSRFFLSRLKLVGCSLKKGDGLPSHTSPLIFSEIFNICPNYAGKISCQNNSSLYRF